MIKKTYPVLLAALFVGGCSWNALYSRPSVSPVQVAFAGYEKPLAGKYLLFISSEGLDQKVEVGGVVCTAHDFSIQIARSFHDSVQKTLANVVDELEVVSTVKSVAEIKSAKARALIVVKAEGLSGNLLVSPGFLRKDTQANVQIFARVKAIGRKGPPAETTIESKASAAPSVGKCLDAYQPVSEATSKAFKQLMQRLGEAVLAMKPLRT